MINLAVIEKNVKLVSLQTLMHLRILMLTHMMLEFIPQSCFICRLHDYMLHDIVAMVPINLCDAKTYDRDYPG